MGLKEEIQGLLELHRLSDPQLHTNLPQLIRRESIADHIPSLPDKIRDDFLDLIQSVADDKPEYAHELEDLLRKIVKLHEIFPPCLFLHRVEAEPHYTAGGGSSDIFKGKLLETNRTIRVALKVPRLHILRSDEKHEATKRFYREAITWRQLRHENIYPFLGIGMEELFGDKPSLISPWSDYGNVTEFLKNHPDHDRVQLIQDVAEGLHYLHNRDPPFVHGDLKGANILIDDQMHACIADFGIGKFLHTPGTYPATTSLKGTMQWMAPEQLALGNDPSKARSPESDVYSFSYVCLEIYTGNVPWPDTAEFTVMEKVLNRQRPERPADIPIPDQIWCIIEKCWKQEPRARMCTKDILAVLSDYRTELDLQMLYSLPTEGLETKVKENLTPKRSVNIAKKITPDLARLIDVLNQIGSVNSSEVDTILKEQLVGRFSNLLGTYPKLCKTTISMIPAVNLNTNGAHHTRHGEDHTRPMEDHARHGEESGPKTPPPAASGSYLALFNQTAAAHHSEVNWHPVCSGPSHALIWEVTCIVDGVQQGKGRGLKQQQAKEEAAQQAYHRLGWDKPDARARTPPSPEHTPRSSPASPPPQRPAPAYLPFLNQTVAQRRLEVQYPAIFDGPPHAGRWTVRALVNGEEKGRGTGETKQAAKEVAAREACIALGWVLP